MTLPTQIISSVITWADIQADGRASVRETFIDDQGNAYTADYMAPIGYDINTRLALDAANLTASFAISSSSGSGSGSGSSEDEIAALTQQVATLTAQLNAAQMTNATLTAQLSSTALNIGVLNGSPANSKIQYVSSALWAAVAAYPSAGTVAAGTLCTNTANSPAVGSERVFVCIAGGITAGTAPTFTNTKGAITEDALTTIYWQECTGQPGVNGDITNCPVWGANLTVILGQIIYDSNTLSLQIANQSFTTHNGAAPTFSATAGTTSTGQDVGEWTSLGLASAFGAGAAPHARITNADAATWQTVVPAQIFIDKNSAETGTATVALSGGQGVQATPNQYLSVTMSGTMPPTSCTSGASINTTSTGSITFQGYGYYYGITISAGSSSSAANVSIANTNNLSNALYLDTCTFELNTTSSTAAINIGGSANTLHESFVGLNNPTFIFGSTSQKLFIGWGTNLITGGTFAGTGSIPSTAISSLLNGNSAEVAGITIIRG